ncbi:type II toxin-antitoxin system RelE/ParE family toxin [Candidatus Woesearchaeota archaeon]|nr:type II toxin-antitoxin system RelE/ParE family toxin [Candidatus Woesearchaeota archaeon]
MFTLIFTEQFEKSFSKVKDREIQKRVWNKILELEIRAPLGKKLKGNPYWSIHVNKYRVVYLLQGEQITIIELLERKHDYREI